MTGDVIICTFGSFLPAGAAGKQQAEGEKTASHWYRLRKKKRNPARREAKDNL